MDNTKIVNRVVDNNNDNSEFDSVPKRNYGLRRNNNINDNFEITEFRDEEVKEIENDIDISGWWTINSFLDFGNLGVTLCNISLIEEKSSTCKKYKCELISQKDKTRLNFLSAVAEVEKNEILYWHIPDSYNNQFLDKLIGANGLIELNGRFISLFSKKVKIIDETQYICPKSMPKRLNYSGGGLCCVFERLEIINKPLKYLIVLRDNQIKLKMKIIKKFEKFNQIDIDILLEKELNEKKYIIKNILVYNTLYVKLPKSEIMTPQQEWEADYFEEQMNELISIFRSLNAKDIEYSIFKNKINNSQKSVKLNLQKKVEGGYSNEESNLHNTKLSYKVSYQKEKKDPAKTIEDLLFVQDIIKELVLYKRNNDLFYFWKHPEWRHQIEHRTDGLCTDMTFTHEETIKNVLNKSISTSLDKFKISYDKNNNYCIKYKILFKIKYFENLKNESNYNIHQNNNNDNDNNNDVDF